MSKLSGKTIGSNSSGVGIGIASSDDTSFLLFQKVLIKNSRKD